MRTVAWIHICTTSKLITYKTDLLFNLLCSLIFHITLFTDPVQQPVQGQLKEVIPHTTRFIINSPFSLFTAHTCPESNLLSPHCLTHENIRKVMQLYT